MPIQRQYSLPNCVLILEGLSNSPEGSPSGSRTELSILTRFECYFAREKQTLVGGRDLLEGLLKATNHCVQAWISGLQTPANKEAALSGRVQLRPAQGGFDLAIPCDLLLQSTVDAPQPQEQSLVQLHISSVQLFDLMEAMDQLAADQQTLPDLQTQIRPRSRQEVRSSFASLEQTAPIAIGAASVAVAAAACFFIPAPKAPEPAKDATTPAPATLGQPVVSPTSKPPGLSPDNSLTPTPVEGLTTPTPTESAAPSSETTTPNPNATIPSAPATTPEAGSEASPQTNIESIPTGTATPDAVPESNNDSPPVP